MQIKALTPREFKIEMHAQSERTYDDTERMALGALMYRKAMNEKRVKLSDLFERPDGNEKEERTVSEIREEVDEYNEWLSRLYVKNDDREEEN